MFDQYEWFKTKIFTLTKINLHAYKERQMKRRIDSLIVKNGLNNYEDYVNMIHKDKVMLEELVNYLTINVSEFYRNINQWKVLEEEVFPYLIKYRGRNLKIWSAACSTGDEPYSILLLLAQKFSITHLKVIATDIDKQVLQKAASGLYHEKSLKNLTKDMISRYFIPMGNQIYQISDTIKSHVEFKQHNLLMDTYPKECDLIICRNVLIYFTEEAKTDIYFKLSDAQPQNGILFVGSTEQITQPKNYKYEPFRSFFYIKK